MSVALLPAAGLAEEHGGAAAAGSGAASEHGGQTAASASAPAAPAASPAAPAEAPAEAPAPEAAPIIPPALKPITITFSGDLAAVDAGGTPATVTVQDRYGVKKEIAVPADAKIAQGAAAKALSDLKTGDKLTVEYTYDVATGKRTAQSISIGEAAPAAQ
ncbi:MAG: hypothetical protein HYZ95_02075 [Candidatus Omnitrophica bacterium]|nr:hypothetical protein [Candidatus Omnitrophota bacterium]